MIISPRARTDFDPRPIAALRLIAILAICFVASAQSAMAGGLSRAYLVANVPVDATGDSGVSAREAARADGETRAFTILLRRLTSASDWDRLPHLPASRITDYLLDMVVDDEHVSANRYLGVYSYRFSPKGVTRLLHDSGLTVWDTPSKPVILIPVLQANNAPVLWESPNQWRDAWQSANVRAGLVPWVMPHGDAEDAQTIDAAAAIANPPAPDKLAAFSQRYGGNDPAIVIAAETDQPGISTLQISVTRYTQAGPETATTSVSAPKPDKTLYGAGVDAALVALEGLWKDEQQKSPSAIAAGAPGGAPVGDGNAQTVIVTAPISGPRDWVKMKMRLGQVPGVQDVRIVVMTPNELKLSMRLAGSLTSLSGSFQQQNLAITQGEQGPIVTLQPGVAPVSP